MSEQNRATGIDTAAALIIGDEVLTGKVQDCNSHWLARELYAMGVALERVLVVPDRVDVIAENLAALAAAYGAVFTSGGVGPTHDDVTYAAVAKAFGRPLQRHPELVARMRAHYGDELNAARLKMADVPEPDELCFNEDMITPVVRVANVYILPGIPVLFRQLFGGLRERFRRQPVYLGLLRTRQAEGDIAALLDTVVAAYPEVRIGSYPRIGDPAYRVKVVVESYRREVAEAAYAAIAAGLDPASRALADPVVEVSAPEDC